MTIFAMMQLKNKWVQKIEARIIASRRIDLDEDGLLILGAPPGQIPRSSAGKIYNDRTWLVPIEPDIDIRFSADQFPIGKLVVLSFSSKRRDNNWEWGCRFVVLNKFKKSIAVRLVRDLTVPRIFHLQHSHNLDRVLAFIEQTKAGRKPRDSAYYLSPRNLPISTIVNRYLLRAQVGGDAELLLDWILAQTRSGMRITPDLIIEMIEGQSGWSVDSPSLSKTRRLALLKILCARKVRVELGRRAIAKQTKA